MSLFRMPNLRYRKNKTVTKNNTENKNEMPTTAMSNAGLVA